MHSLGVALDVYPSWVAEICAKEGNDYSADKRVPQPDSGMV